MSNNDKKWYKLDNAGKIFPPTATRGDSKVFRFACELYEDVDKEILQAALDKTIEEYPLFLSTLQKGLFWYYLETTSIKPKVREEDIALCDKMDDDLLFRVSYYKKRINLEVHHALTDGTGALSFLKTLVTNYLSSKYSIKENFVIDDSSIYEKEADSFEKYYKKSTKLKLPKDEKAYTLKGRKHLEDRLQVIEGIVSTRDVLTLAKSHNTTVTIYLTSILIQSVGSTMSRKEKRKPVVVTIPVNLRKYFKSNTARNFFSTITVSYKFKDDNDKIEDIIDAVSLQFKSKLTKENLDKQMNELAVLENVFFIRLVPVFIKDIVLKYFHIKSRGEQTIALSNIGIVDMPKELQQYIKLFDVFTSTDCTQLCMCSYLDNMTLSFASHFVDTEIQKNFFTELSKQNIDVVINTNILEDSEYEEVL
ncbi:MAG: hypothetical protein IJO43_00860 [Bacilli bacterium]|nr:hypothetical protein [Bacilli bacterium]